MFGRCGVFCGQCPTFRGDIQNLAKKLNCRKILIISSSLHLFRIEILLNDIKPPEGLEIIFEPYLIADTYPKVNFITLVSQVHHEWISFALYELLPRTWYDRLVFFLRGCSWNLFLTEWTWFLQFILILLFCLLTPS